MTYLEDLLEKHINKKAKQIAHIKIMSLESEAQQHKDELDLEHKRKMEYVSAKNDAFEKMFAQKTQGFPWFASAWAEYIALLDTQTERYLVKKKNPALKAAEIVKGIKHEKKQLNKENRVLKYTINPHFAPRL